MSAHVFKTLDANEAVAKIAYQLNEVIAIYPITPASSMGEWADAWAATEKKNLWGTIPSVIEMQSEAGAAGAVHGALQTGALATTFTASQGLLLMIPNMYKIAGELTPTVFHIAARTLATHALSIFGDHSDVMGVRSTGWAMLCSSSVQEAQDFALISHAATLETRLPFIHFFDGFRTSHEVAKIETIPTEVLREMVSYDRVLEHRARALNPEHPVLRGTAQNPDVFFQSREAGNPFYAVCADKVQAAMDKFGQLTGRSYKLFEYYGAPDADRVLVLMGSACETATETVDHLADRGEKVGVLKVRLYRPFDNARFIDALPATVKRIAVLDRTKEPGGPGEPLYLDCVNALMEHWGEKRSGSMPKIIGGRYGLSSKEFTPAMVKATFDNLKATHPKAHFTVGITDDVSHTSLECDADFCTEDPEVYRAVFYGLGSDGTVGANKEAIKIIGENTDNFAQGYFVYDSKKSGATTVSHLRFGPRPIRSTYLIYKANFVGCHQPSFLERVNVAENLQQGGILLVNSPHVDDVWAQLSDEIQQSLIAKQARLFAIDASKLARDCGIPGRINTIMETCFFAISGILPLEEAVAEIKKSISKAYAKRGPATVEKNCRAVDAALTEFKEIKVPNAVTPHAPFPPVSPEAPEFVRNVLGTIIGGHGDRLPVSAFSADGTFPVGTARWEKRNLAAEIPVWDADACIQCGKCVFVCPHAAIRSKAYKSEVLAGAPETFVSRAARLPEWKGLNYTLQVAPEDCTGCGICVDVCPARSKSVPNGKAINMAPQPPLRDKERLNWDFFLKLPDMSQQDAKVTSVRGMQALEPLFEFSGACSGCGETPYIKLLTQLFGDRLFVSNATGCSSIYGGNLPTTPWTTNKQGRGPSWCNSLFEDNAEFGLGFRVSLDKQAEFAAELLKDLAPVLGDDFVNEVLTRDQSDAVGVEEQRRAVAFLKNTLKSIETDKAKLLLPLADALVRKSVWILGGDGWAYDIGFGGLDHVLASGKNVKVLVLDTEVYSNTGGQKSKSTPRGAIAKFAAGGKPSAKKDLGLIAMTYGNIYVASVAMGAKDEHTLKTFLEAEAYDGPALIIAYSHCIAHGINIGTAMQNQKAAVKAGHWLLYRYNPDLVKLGQNPLQLDSPAPEMNLADFMMTETRFSGLKQARPEQAQAFFEAAQVDSRKRYDFYSYLSRRDFKSAPPNGDKSENGSHNGNGNGAA